MTKYLTLFFFISLCFSFSAQEQYYDKQRLKEERKATRLEERDSIRARIREQFVNIGPDYNADSVRKELESGPHFSLFKDNYFVGGIPLGQKIRANNSNVKFQLSISQRLTKSIPQDSFLLIISHK